MKYKKLSFLVLLLILLAALPMLGNRLIQNTINERLELFEHNGLEVINNSMQSTYLQTHKHYEFLLSDTDKFLLFLSKYSNGQLPPYVHATLDGVLLGVDVEYTNFPLFNETSIDIYPLQLPKEMGNHLKDKDENLYDYLEKFLYAKGILYHINYNIISEDFSGHMKDIQEQQHLIDGTLLTFDLKGMTFSGNGKLVAPKQFETDVKRMDLTIKRDDNKLNFEFIDFTSSSDFKAQSSYHSSAEFKNISFFFEGSEDNISLDAQKVQLDASSYAQGVTAAFNTKSFIHEFDFVSSKESLKLQDFASDINVSKLDKLVLEKLQKLLSLANQTKKVDSLLVESIVDLVSKGLKIDISDLSVKNIILNGSEELKSVSLLSTIDIKRDSKLITKINIFPLLVVEDLDIELYLKLSDKIYAKFIENLPLASEISRYARKEKKSVYFDILLKDTKLQINGKPLN